MMQEGPVLLIDYVSSAMDAMDFAELFRNSSKTPGQQAQKYNRLIIEGLAENGLSVRAVTVRPVTVENYSGKYLSARNLRSGRVCYHYCSVLNVKGIKILWQTVSAFCAVLLGGCDAVVMDVLNASAAYGAAMAARLRRKPCIGIVTDLPELMVTGTNQNHVKLVRKITRKCSGFVLLTEAMNGPINPEHKPYVIVEALCDSSIKPQAEDQPRKKDTVKCMYAGLLDVRYGVKTMVDGFILADLPDTELHIFGDGPYVDELQKVSQAYPNVVYHGVAMNDEVVRKETCADLLINPRPTHEAFTKYSFPSKNIEYMASGTPVLTTNLSGMPEEYKPFVYLIDDESEAGIARAIRNTLSIPWNEREKKGLDAQSFVLEKKSNVVQCKRILSLLLGK